MCCLVFEFRVSVRQGEQNSSPGVRDIKGKKGNTKICVLVGGSNSSKTVDNGLLRSLMARIKA
jgi:hypothetical protein